MSRSVNHYKNYQNEELLLPCLLDGREVMAVVGLSSSLSHSNINQQDKDIVNGVFKSQGGKQKLEEQYTKVQGSYQGPSRALIIYFV